MNTKQTLSTNDFKISLNYKNGLFAYTKKEELINGFTHAIGVVLSILGLFQLLYFDFISDAPLSHYLSHTLYALSMTLLFTSSTLYHLLKSATAKKVFKYLDHASIYLLIAGSYTPFLVIKMGGTVGAKYAAIIWGVAVLGILYEIFFLGKYRVLSVLFYVLIGWMAVFFLEDFKAYLSKETINLIITGGIVYASGTIFYLIKKIPYHHGIWHLFVLAGASILYYSILTA